MLEFGGVGGVLLAIFIHDLFTLMLCSYCLRIRLHIYNMHVQLFSLLSLRYIADVSLVGEEVVDKKEKGLG